MCVHIYIYIYICQELPSRIMHIHAHHMRAMILDPISTYVCNNIVDPYFPAAPYGLKC